MTDCFCTHQWQDDVIVLLSLITIDCSDLNRFLNFLEATILKSRYLFVQNQQWKHLKNVWNMFKVNKIVDVVLVKRRQNHITEVVVVSLMLTWTDNSNFSGCSIVDFEQVIAELNSANHNIQTFWYFFSGVSRRLKQWKILDLLWEKTLKIPTEFIQNNNHKGILNKQTIS